MKCRAGIPGVQNGKTVEVEYTLEVNFKLEKNKEDKRQGFANFNTKAFFGSNTDGIDSFSQWNAEPVCIRANSRYCHRRILGRYSENFSANAPADRQTGKYRYIRYGSSFLQHRTPVFKKRANEISKARFELIATIFWV